MYPACSVPIKAAACARWFRSAWSTMSLALISHRLQNWYGRKAISQHGFVPQSLLLDQYTPGSPQPLASTLPMSTMNSSCVTSPLGNTAELLARPRCSFSSHHAPLLHVSIASSSLSNRLINAALRIPPANTALAIIQIISCASSVDSFRPRARSRRTSSCSKHFFSGSGPGALPPVVISSAPFGLMSDTSKRTRLFP